MIARSDHPRYDGRDEQHDGSGHQIAGHSTNSGVSVVRAIGSFSPDVGQGTGPAGANWLIKH